MADSSPTPNNLTSILDAVQNITTIKEKLETYTSGVVDFLTTTTPLASQLDDFATTAQQLNTDHLEEIATVIKDKALDLGAGAITSEIYNVASMLRESSLRSFNKSYIYQNAIVEYGAAIEEKASEAAIAINRIRGASPEQV